MIENLRWSFFTEISSKYTRRNRGARWLDKMLKVVSVLLKSNANYKANVRYIKILKWLRCFRHKIANFSLLRCLAIPRRDLSREKKTNQTNKKWAERLGVMLEFKKNILLNIYHITNYYLYLQLSKLELTKLEPTEWELHINENDSQFRYHGHRGTEKICSKRRSESYFISRYLTKWQVGLSRSIKSRDLSINYI